MKVLGIDTSLSVATVALVDDEKILGEISVNVKNKHSETLMPIIKNLLDVTKTKPKEIEKIVCGVGPGSFTGVRIGVATAKAFAFSNNIKVIPVSTLDALACNIKYTDKKIVSIIDGKRNCVFTSSYKNMKRESAQTFCDIEELLDSFGSDKNIIFNGDGAISYKNLILERNFQIAEEKDLFPSATNMIFFALENLQDEEISGKDLKPIYLRKSQAERDYFLKNIDEIKIEIMEEKHIDEVYEIEKNTFADPWSKNSFLTEILANQSATYFVATFFDEVIGYGGIWTVAGDGSVTNIAVREEYKKMGVGQKIVASIIKQAKEKKCDLISLEVRVSNEKAIKLYEKNGFKIVGTRKEYYNDNGEDAFVMYMEL